MLCLGYAEGQAIDLHTTAHAAELHLVGGDDGRSLHVDGGLGSDFGEAIDHGLAEVTSGCLAAHLELQFGAATDNLWGKQKI